MPFAVSVDAEKKRVTVIGTGIVTPEDAADARRAILEHPDFHSGCDGMADLTGCDISTFAADRIRMLSQGSPFGPVSRLAIVVADPLAYGLVRMYETYVEQAGGAPLRVFTDNVQAEAWLARVDDMGR